MVNWLKYRYSWAPVLSAVIWAATIITLFALWRADGPPWYDQNRKIIYISYAGSKWKGVFAPGAVLTSIFYVITLIMDVQLRRRERIPVFLQRKESISAILSIVFGIIAGIGLSGLAIFDVHNFNNAHWTFFVIFIVCVFLNGVCNLFEIKHLSRDHYQLGYLRRNAWAKLIIAGTAAVLAILFAILSSVCGDDSHNPNDWTCNPDDSAAAVMEWIIAVLFVGFLITYAIDFRAIEAPPAALRAIQAQDAALEAGQPNQQAELQAGEQRAGPKPAEPTPTPAEIGSGVA